jgi:hypothetical protein
MGAVVQLKSGATNGTAQLRLYTFQNNFILPTNAIPGIDSSTAYSMAVLQVSAKQIKARVYVEDANGNFATIFDQNITTYDDNNPNINRALKFLIKLEEVDGNDRIMFKTVNPEDNTTIGNVAWFNTPNDVSINTFEKAKVRANTDAVDMAVDRGLKFNLFNVFELIDDSSDDGTTNEPAFDKTQALDFTTTFLNDKSLFFVDSYDSEVSFFQLQFASSGGLVTEERAVTSTNTLVKDGNGSGTWSIQADGSLNFLETFEDDKEICENNITLYLLEDNTSSSPAFIKIGGEMDESCTNKADGKVWTHSDDGFVDVVYVGALDGLSSDDIANFVAQASQNKYEREMEYPYQVLGTATMPAMEDGLEIHLEARPLYSNSYDHRGINLSSTEGSSDFILGLYSGSYVMNVHINNGSNGYVGYVYDAVNAKWLDHKEVRWENNAPLVGAINTNDFNGSNQFSLDFNLTQIYADRYKMTGTVVVDENFTTAEYCTKGMDYTDIQPCEWDSNGTQGSGYNNWYAGNKIGIELNDANTGEWIGRYDIKGATTNNGDGTKTYSYTQMLSKEGNFTMRISVESFDSESKMSNWQGYYYNPQTQKIIDEMNIQWVESDATGHWRPDPSLVGYLEVADRDGNKTAHFGEIDLISFENSRLSLKGIVTFNDVDKVQIEMLNLQTGHWFGWKEVRNSGDNFDISLPEGVGKYIIRVSKVDGYNWESYYYNPETSKFKMEQNIHWIEGENNVWMPDLNETGYLNITEGMTSENIPTLNIDFTALDSSFYTISGEITVPATFEVRKYNSNYWNNISFEVTEKDTGRWIGWYEVDADANNTSGNNVYKYKIKLSEEADYIVRINMENGKAGIWESYFIDFPNAKLVNSNDVHYKEVEVEGQSWTNWVPDFDNGISLGESNPNVTANINFVELENNTYKISGTVKLPSDFTPSHNWQDYSMVRIEAIDAATGAWLGNGHISTEDNGTDYTYNYVVKLKGADENTNVVLKLVKESQGENGSWDWESYFLDYNQTSGEFDFVSEETVKWVESDQQDQWGYTYWVPDTSEIGTFNFAEGENEIILDIDYESEENAYASNKIVFAGTVTLASEVELGSTSNHYWNNIRVEAIDKLTGDWVTSRDVTYKSGANLTYDFELELPEAGLYILRVVTELDGKWNEYYINFGDDHEVHGSNENNDTLVDGQKVEWVQAESIGQWNYKNWLPNPEVVGYIDLTTNEQISGYDIDLATFENSIIKLSGSVTVAEEFVVGEVYENGQWAGYKNIRIEAINKTTGEWLGSTEVNREKVDGKYPFTIKLGDTGDYIIRIAKEEGTPATWKHEEIYYNFGNDHAIAGDTDKLVSGKNVQWVQSGNNWLPDPTKTGWISISNSETDFNIDLTTFGQNDYKIQGSVTVPSDINLSSYHDSVSIELIDVDSGNWLGWTEVEANGSYSINVGEEANNYIVRVSLNHNDQNNGQNSYWKSMFVDFGTDHAIDDNNISINSVSDKLVNDSNIQWKEVQVDGQNWSNWIPDVNYLEVTGGTKEFVVNMDLSVDNSVKLSGIITGLPEGIKWANIYMHDPVNGYNIHRELKENSDGNYSFNTRDIQNDGNYTMELSYEDSENKWHHYFVKNAASPYSIVEQEEVFWSDLGNGYWGPDSSEVSYMSFGTDSQITINASVTQAAIFDVTFTIANVNKENVSGSMWIPGKPFNRWVDCNWDTVRCTQSGADTVITFDDVKAKDGYVVNFWIDGQEYYYNVANELVKNVEWIESGNFWKPDVDAYNLSGIANGNNQSVDVSLPAVKKITGTLNLGSNYANEDLYLNVWQHNGNDWAWDEVTLDNNGIASFSLTVEGGNNYRFEVYGSTLGGFVKDADTVMISNQNSWNEDGNWGPKPSTLFNVSGDTNLSTDGELTIPGLNTITFTVTGLDGNVSGNAPTEGIYVSVEGVDSEGYYGSDNNIWTTSTLTYTDKVSVSIPDGSYRVVVFPTAHKHGIANGADGTSDFTYETFNWDWDSATVVPMNADMNLTIALPSTADLKSISGTVNLGDGDIELGWIEAWSKSTQSGLGTQVDKNGSYIIKGLEAADDYKIEYYSWQSTDRLKKTGVDISEDVTDFDLTKATIVHEVNATIGGDTSAVSSVFLLSVSDDNSTWDIIQEVDFSGNDYSFTDLADIEGENYAVTVSSRQIVSGAYKYVMQDPIDENNNTINIDVMSGSNATISVSHGTK